LLAAVTFIVDDDWLVLRIPASLVDATLRP
jgi:hypothetical protein